LSFLDALKRFSFRQWFLAKLGMEHEIRRRRLLGPSSLRRHFSGSAGETLHAATQKTHGVAGPRNKSNSNEEQDARDPNSSSAENDLQPPLAHGVTTAFFPR